ncbi:MULTISPECIES: hypothetical protein [unclassified Ruegeria]|uniref:hypothetical protein n=1 Tax=unclassified Ruegeria TaxID=2625375 RepID=UPI001ADC966A|nr:MULTISPECIES: hypothetical protein [unclassified Ruegeria]MBO9412887.1 hypothetical protein [Ruegeria sp. R8_1]MBO9416566.1 hypothetical protein [Ruegeria sp. R8_2]
MLRHFAILLALSAQAVVAQTALSGSEFDDYTRGKTLFYGFQGEVYGVERYLPNRRVIWSFLDGDCKEGVWYEQEDQICFLYEDRLDPQCWRFTRSGAGLIAQFEGNPDQTELYEAEDIDEEMICLGPEVGV